jgi:catechol 2,3-dioxygenase-like lactoylglutathione lyase family enzyme
MTGPMKEEIRHVGVLVPNLEEAIEHWERLTGWTFKEISRYEPDSYVCTAAPEPHPHSQRIAMSIDGPPHVELLEANPAEPTHAPSQMGLHHIAFAKRDDVEAKRRELAAMGVGDDGRSIAPDGSTLLFFADPASAAGYGVRVEYTSTADQPVYVERDSPAYQAEQRTKKEEGE